MNKTEKNQREITENEKQELESLMADPQLNKRMEQMEHEYKEIKVPTELKGRVFQAMQEGRDALDAEQVKETDRVTEKKEVTKQVQDDRKPARKKTASHYFLRTAQTAAAALLVVTVLANTSAETAYAMSRIPVLGAITKVVTFRTYEQQNENSEAKVEVPKIEAGENSGIAGAAEQINKSVEDYTNQIIGRFEEDVKRDGEEAHIGLYTEYKVLADNNRFFTLKIQTDEIMASGYQSAIIYNVDKKTDKILELKDMFPAGTDYVTLLSDAVKDVMRKNMQEDENKSYFLDDGMDSDFNKIKEDQNFYINDAGRMVLVFNEYDVAPGYMGLIEIELPDSVFHADGL